MPKYTRKPRPIEAVQFTGDNIDECAALVGARVMRDVYTHPVTGQRVPRLVSIDAHSRWSVVVGMWVTTDPDFPLVTAERFAEMFEAS